jgi:hypothetical protein
VPWLDRGIGRNALAAAAVLTIVALGSAAYTLVPGSGYLVVGLVAMLLICSPAITVTGTPGLPALPLMGFALFNGLFMLRSVGDSLDLRTQLVHVLSLGTFVLSLTAWRAVLRLDRPRAAALLSAAALCGICVLLMGQFAEMAGLIDRRNLGVTPGDTTYAFRPGGLLNPNMTAAIAVVLLFSIGESQRARPLTWTACLAAVLVTVVVALTQSRTLIAALLLYLLVLAARRPRMLLVVPAIIAVASFAVLDQSSGEIVEVLLQRAIARFDGSLASDVSNAERLQVMMFALESAGRSPVFGNGYLHLVDLAGISSHNQAVDLMVDFGAIGLVSGAIAFGLLYLPASPMLWAVCLLPTLMFSHNFFDSAPFQACVGMALAVERERLHPR